MNIMIAGEGGQGIQVVAKILSDSAFNEKYNVSYIPHYGVEMRMGISFAYVKISKNMIAYPKFNYSDILVVMSKREINTIKKFITKETKVINFIEKKLLLIDKKINPKSLNMLSLGVIVKTINSMDYKIIPSDVEENIKKTLRGKLIEDNIKAFTEGLNLEEKYFNNDINKLKSSLFIPLSDKDNLKTVYRFPSLCKACGLCIEKCPVKALSASKNEINYFGRNIPQVDINKCIACQICENICPDSAIKVCKKK